MGLVQTPNSYSAVCLLIIFNDVLFLGVETTLCLLAHFGRTRTISTCTIAVEHWNSNLFSKDVQQPKILIYLDSNASKHRQDLA